MRWLVPGAAPHERGADGALVSGAALGGGALGVDLGQAAVNVRDGAIWRVSTGFRG